MMLLEQDSNRKRVSFRDELEDDIDKVGWEHRKHLAEESLNCEHNLSLD